MISKNLIKYTLSLCQELNGYSGTLKLTYFMYLLEQRTKQRIPRLMRITRHRFLVNL